MVNAYAADGVTVVELERGPVNAIDLELLDELVDALANLSGPLVLTGRGRAFSAGVDLRRIVEDGDEYIARFLTRLSDAFMALFNYPAPTVAAVNGHAIAGGCVFALCCDFRIMAAGTIGLAELPVGVAFPRSAFEIVRHALGTGAGRAMLLAETFGRDDALALGMVDEVVDADELLEAARRRAKALGRAPAELYAATKHDLHAPALAAIRDWPDNALPVWTSPETKQRLTDYLASLGKKG